MAPQDQKADPATSREGVRFLDGGGAVGALLRDFDWASHPLGPPQDWPAALKLSVGLCLRSSFPTAIYWGSEFLLLYNDAWTVLADNHPWALGRPAAEARPDIWPVLGAQFRETLAAGEGISHVAQRLMMVRGGALTETFWSYNSSPILDEDGVAHGILNQGLEVTAQVLNERALIAAKSERDFVLHLVEQQRVQRDSAEVMHLTAEAVGQYLGVDRAGFFDVTPDHVVEYGPSWVGGALSPLTRPIPAAVFGARWDAAMRTGETIAFGMPDDRDAPPAEALGLVGSRAGVTVPLLRSGEWQGGFYLSHAEPRNWTGNEIALIEEVAELSWDAVARVRAVERLRALNADLAGEVAARTAERDRLWEVSEDLLGIATRDGRWLSINPAWERALGWSAEHILGRDSQWLRHPEDTGGSAAEIARIAAAETTHRLEKRLRTRAGDYRTFAWQTTLFGDRLYTSARDITEERRQHQELLAAETRTRMVLQAMDGVGVWTYDLANDRFESDSEFAALYGFSPEHVARGVTLADVMARIHPEDLPKMQATIAHVRATGGDGANEYRLQLPDGSVRWIMARNHVLRDPDGKPGKVVGVGVDVSRQRELEERLRQSQKMEAVGQLTGGLAHDFNNLLTGISGALELMQLRLNQGRIDDLPRYIGAAQSGAARAAALTHRLLAFSRRQPLDPRPTDVAKLIAGMEDLVRGTLGPSIVLDVVTPADSWPILADANQLENALLNLCINARDAMPDGGMVTIATHNVVLDEKAAGERDVPPGPYLALSVADTGTGMSPEVIARAFDPFFTTKPMGQGTGLGLSMIYGFVRQSGGHVQIDSVRDQGTTMTLLLPRHIGEAADLIAAGAGAAIPVGAGETVLVVDDEPTVRMLVMELLGELGYSAIETETGEQALKVLKSQGRIDLLITDVGLPGGMNGRQVADAARASRPELPVLFITGFAENAVVGDGPLEPGMALIAKPFAMDTLAARIRAMLAGA